MKGLTTSLLHKECSAAAEARQSEGVTGRAQHCITQRVPLLTTTPAALLSKGAPPPLGKLHRSTGT